MPLLWLSAKVPPPEIHHLEVVTPSWKSKGRKGKIRLYAVQDLGVLPKSKWLTWQLLD